VYFELDAHCPGPVTVDARTYTGVRLTTTAAVPRVSPCKVVLYSGDPSMGLEVSASLQVLSSSGAGFHVLSVTEGSDGTGGLLAERYMLFDQGQEVLGPYVTVWLRLFLLKAGLETWGVFGDCCCFVLF
jgi:hypothetical protein